MKEHDIVVLAVDLPKVPKKTRGTIVHVYFNNKSISYEVEFIVNNERFFKRVSEGQIYTYNPISFIINDLMIELENMPMGSDIGDIGNTIGIIIGENISDKPGYDKDSFMSGLKHGFSLIDGTHDNLSK